MKNRISHSVSKFMHYSIGDKVYITFVYLILAFVALITFYPIYFTVIASFSDAYAVYRGEVTWVPKGFTTDAYAMVFQNDAIWMGYANTIFYTVVGTIFNMCLTVPAAWTLSRKNIVGGKFYTVVFLLSMYLGGGMIPTYLLYNSLHMLDTRSVLIVCTGLSVYNTIMCRTYFKSNISDSLTDAARIDGANEFYIFFKVVLPLSAPILAVLTLYYAVSHWNSYFNAMIYVRKDALQPLQLILRRILILNQSMFDEVVQTSTSAEEIAQAQRLSYLAITMKYALVFIASLPMLVAYPFIQKHFTKGVMLGSIKE